MSILKKFHSIWWHEIYNHITSVNRNLTNNAVISVANGARSVDSLVQRLIGSLPASMFGSLSIIDSITAFGRDATHTKILLNQTEIRWYLPFSGWFGTKRPSVWCLIIRKMVNTIWFQFDIIRFRKDISVCWAKDWKQRQISTWIVNMKQVKF